MILEPTISSAVLRIKKVDSLIFMYEKHKSMKEKIWQTNFVNYEEIGDKFKEGFEELEEDFNVALGMERHINTELSDTEFNYCYAKVSQKQRTFENKLKMLFWELHRQNWPKNPRASIAATKFQTLWRIMKAKEAYQLKKELRIILENISSKKISRLCGKRPRSKKLARRNTLTLIHSRDLMYV